MGQEQGKYHISKDGKVFRINEDGSFTELGNAEALDKHKNSYRKASLHKGKFSRSFWIILSIVIFVVVTFAIYALSSYSSYDDYDNGVTSDSASYEVVSNEAVCENPDFDEWRKHALNYIYELITSPTKSHYDSPEYSATNSRINAAIDMFYHDKYAEVEENMFYPAYRQNDATAQYYLGCIYANGNRGITQDSKNAFYWFERAAENGHGAAAYYLARDYYRDKDNKRYWMQKSSDLKNGEAMLALAKSYENGDFTEIDVNKAIELYNKIINTFGDSLAYYGSPAYYSYEAAERLKELN